MNIFQKRSALFLASAAAVAGALLPGAAHAVPAATSAAPHGVTSGHGAPSAVSDSGIKIDLASASINISQQIFDIATDAVEKKQNRSGYVKSLMEGAFYELGQRYNIVVINESNAYAYSLSNVVYNATVSGYYSTFRILAFDSGEFHNNGDGGYINWAFRGWYTQDGNHVSFRKG